MELLQSNINGILSAGAESLGQWQSYKGGAITTANTTTRDPGAQYARIIPGRKTIDAVTLGVDYDPVKHAALQERLEHLAGTPAVVTVGRIERDGAQNILRTQSRVGVILEVHPPEGDTNSETDKAQLEVVIGING